MTLALVVTQPQQTQGDEAEPEGVWASVARWLEQAVDTVGAETLLWAALVVVVVAVAIILWLAWRSGRIGKITPREQSQERRSWSLRRVGDWLRDLKYRLSNKSRYDIPMCLVLGADRGLAENYAATLSRSGSSRRTIGTPKTVEGGVFGWGDSGELYTIPMQVPVEEGVALAGLEYLADFRPERPADGIVLDFPVRVLRGAEDGVEAWAESLRAQLQLAQSEWDFNLPIYVVVSGLEQVEGFSGFLSSASIAPHKMFGWSGALLPIDQPKGQWCATAMEALQQRVLELQLMQPLDPSGGQPDDTFMFPLHFEALLGRLRHALVLTFTESVHYARDEVRGMYFAASTDWIAVDEDNADAKGQPLTFVRDLLEHKVFAESRLGQPLSRGVLSKNRTLRKLQIGIVAVAAVAFFVLAYQSYRLWRQVDQLGPALDRMTELTISAAKVGPAAVEANDDERLALAQDFVRELPKLEGSRLARPTMPISYLYRLDERLASGLASGSFPEFIFPVMACELRRRADSLVRVQAEVRPKATVPRVLWLEEAVVFLEHLDLMQRLSRPDSDDAAAAGQPGEVGAIWGESAGQGGTWPRSGSQSLAWFADLVEYTLDYRLGDGFYEASDLYRKALSDTDYALEVEGESAPCGLGRAWAQRLSADAEARMASLAQHAGQVAGGGGIDRHEQIMAQIERWAAGDFEPTGKSVSVLVEEVKGFRELANKRLELFFPPAESGHGHSEEAAPCRDFRERTAGLQESVGGSAAKSVLRTVTRQVGTAQCDMPLRAHLLSLQYPWIGNLFVQQRVEGEAGVEVFVVNPKLDQLVRGLEALSGTALARVVLDEVPPRSTGNPAVAVDFAGAPAGADGMDFVWDVPELQNALDYHADYRTFVESGCPDCGPAVSGLVRRIALQAIDNAVVTAQVSPREMPKSLKFVAAQREAALAQRVDAIRPALDVLVELRGVYGRLRSEGGRDGLTSPRENFANLAHLYVMSQLREVTRVANEDSGLYRPTPTPDWGQPHAAGALFGLSDRASVDEYLTSQLNRVQYLASEYADPLLVYLGTGQAQGEFTTGGDITLWRETLVQLDKFRREDATNTAAKLRKLFVEHLLATGEQRCETVGSLSPATTGVDLFSTAYNHLLGYAGRYCRGEITIPETEPIEDAEPIGPTGGGTNAYRSLAEDFNDKLAWRYPFVSSPRRKPEVAPEVVVAFFTEHPVAGTNLVELVEASGATQTKKEAALLFLSRLRQVEALVDRTLAPPKGSPPGVVLETEFRVERERSEQSKNILRWTWTVGDTRVVYPYATEPEPQRWEPGRPVSLALQWAADADVRPESLDKCPRTKRKLKGLVGTFGAGGDWALLRMLDCFRDEQGDAQTVLMRFNTHVTYVRVPAKVDAPVFMRVHLLGVDPETEELVPVTLPQHFPTFAPSL